MRHGHVHAQRLSSGNPNRKEAQALLSLCGPELAKYIAEQVRANPFLRYRYKLNLREGKIRSGADFLSKARNELYDSLDEKVGWPTYEQFKALADLEVDDSMLRIGAFILEHIDGRTGYFSQPLASVARNFSVAVGEVESALDIVQSLGEAGFAARNEQDSYLLQVRKLYPDEAELHRMLLECWGPFFNAQGKELLDCMGCSPERLGELLQMLKGIVPYPAAFSGTSSEHESGTWETGENPPEIHVCENADELYVTDSIDIQDTLVELDAIRYEALPVITEEDAQLYRQARDFVKIIIDRRMFPKKLGQSLLELQREYFETKGDVLKSLTHDAVAAKLNVHRSTVSRYVAAHSLMTPWNEVVELRQFFTGRGRQVEVQQVRDAVARVIEAESKPSPLTDDAIAELLRKEGFELTGRTVNNHRRHLGIPSARKRLR